MGKIFKRLFLPVLLFSLLTPFLLSSNVKALEVISYCTCVDNQYGENLIIFINGELYCMAHSEELTRVGYWNDFSLELKDARGSVVYSIMVAHKEFENKDFVIVIPPANNATCIDTSGMNSYELGIHNPTNEMGIVLVNSILVDIIRPHCGKYSNCWLYPETKESNTEQVIEIKNAQWEIVFSQTCTLSDLNASNWTVTAMPSTPVTFSLNFDNLTAQPFNIKVNGQIIGNMLAEAEKTFKVSTEPRLEWGFSIGIIWEKYLIEISDINGNVLDSREFDWIVFELNKWKISIPFSPTIGIHNDTNETLTILIKEHEVGNIEPFQKKYFFNLNIAFVDKSFTVIAKNLEGHIIYHNKLSTSYPQNYLYWELVLQPPNPINWILLWSITSAAMVVLGLTLWLVIHRLKKKKTMNS
jgi:hypothetical protein